MGGVLTQPVPAADAAAPWRPRLPIEADELRRLLPHRWPFLFLDRVIELEPGVRGLGLKNVAVAEPHFAGHFLEQSVMPGVLIVESLAQLGGVVVGSADGPGGAGRSYLAAINRMRFRRPVRPGDQLVLTAERQAAGAGVAEVAVSARCEGRVVADGRLILAI